jgi:hypothetical protein
MMTSFYCYGFLMMSCIKGDIDADIARDIGGESVDIVSDAIEEMGDCVLNGVLYTICRWRFDAYNKLSNYI